MDAAPKTILCFPFAGDSIGGSHVSTLGLLRRLDPSRYRVLVVPEVPDGQIAAFFSEFECVPDPAPSARPETPGMPFGLWKAARALKGVPARARFLRQQGVDIVHSNDGRTHAKWSVAARLARIPFLWHHRGDPEARGLRLAAPLLAKRVLTVSSFAVPPAGRWSAATRAEVVHSPFDSELSIDRAEARKALLTELGLSEDTLIVGFFGNLIERKRPVAFVDMVVAIAKALARPVAGVMFGGHGQDEAQEELLRRRLKEQDAARIIHLMGFRDNGAFWIAACDQLIVPAVREPFGRTLIEAMLVGTPVIATQSGGNVEALSGGRGVLVPPDNVDALAEASVRLANFPEEARAMADRAQQDARTRFSEQGHADRVSAIYEEMVRAG